MRGPNLRTGDRVTVTRADGSQVQVTVGAIVWQASDGRPDVIAKVQGEEVKVPRTARKRSPVSRRRDDPRNTGGRRGVPGALREDARRRRVTRPAFEPPAERAEAPPAPLECAGCGALYHRASVSDAPRGWIVGPAGCRCSGCVVEPEKAPVASSAAPAPAPVMLNRPRRRRRRTGS